MMRRKDIAQPGSVSPPALRLASGRLALAIPMLAVAVLVLVWVVAPYSPTALLLGPAPHPAFLDPYREALFYATGGRLVPQE